MIWEEDWDKEILIRTFKQIISPEGAELKICGFYPERSKEQVNKDCSSYSLGNVTKKEYLKELDKLVIFLKQFEDPDSVMNTERFRQFQRFCLKTKVTILLTLKVGGY